MAMKNKKENNMSGWLILTVMVLYFLTAVDFLLKADYPMALVFFAYAVSNIGLYLAARA